MKHYDNVEWILYKRNLLDTKIYNEMKEHLFQCDDCMDIFISLIDEKEIADVEKFIPKDFSENIMEKIENVTPIKQEINRNKIKKTKYPKDFFLYYTAVAAVAIVLTASGVFNIMVDNIPTNIKLEQSKIDTNKIYEVSEKITQGTSSFIYNFNFIKNKEVK